MWPTNIKWRSVATRWDSLESRPMRQFLIVAHSTVQCIYFTIMMPICLKSTQEETFLTELKRSDLWRVGATDFS